MKRYWACRRLITLFVEVFPIKGGGRGCVVAAAVAAVRHRDPRRVSAIARPGAEITPGPLLAAGAAHQAVGHHIVTRPAAIDAATLLVIIAAAPAGGAFFFSSAPAHAAQADRTRPIPARPTNLVLAKRGVERCLQP